MKFLCLCKILKDGKIRFFFIVFLFFSFVANAQPTTDASVEPEQTRIFDPAGKIFVEGSFFGGGGSKKHEVGETTEGDKITISGGGGIGGGFSLGYGITSEMSLIITVGGQNSSLSKKVENAEGSFSRTIFLGTVKYAIPLSSSGQIKIGGGAGYYSPGELDIDASDVPGGAHQIATYDGSTGFHFLAEYEGYFTLSENMLSWSAGLKYYNVKYDITEFEQNGASISIDNVRDEYCEFDGGGFDLIISLAYFFN